MTSLNDLLRAEASYNLKMKLLEKARRDADHYRNVVEVMATECQRLENIIYKLKENLHA